MNYSSNFATSAWETAIDLDSVVTYTNWTECPVYWKLIDNSDLTEVIRYGTLDIDGVPSI